MELDAFQRSPSGQIQQVYGIEDYAAFVPHPLPTRLNAFEIDHELLRLNGEAEAALARLDGMGYLLPNPKRVFHNS